MTIRYNEQSQSAQVTRETYEVLETGTFSFPVRQGAAPYCSLTSKKVESIDGPGQRVDSFKIDAGRDVGVRLTNETGPVEFPILNADGTPSGETCSVEKLFRIVQSAFIARAAQVDA